MVEYRTLGYRDVHTSDHGTDNTFKCYPKMEALYQGHEAGMNLRCDPEREAKCLHVNGRNATLGRELPDTKGLRTNASRNRIHQIRIQ